jgi:hypothetical protein
MWYPLYALTNSLIGYLGCILLFMALFYRNTWGARRFPFLSQFLFDDTSNGTFYSVYNQSEILTPAFEIDQAALQAKGLPNLTATYLGYLITSSMGFTATFTHMVRKLKLAPD